MWARGMKGPWNTERYSELDVCLVFRRWSNSIKNVESDSLTNIHTDHLALIVKISQKLKALGKAEHGKELRGAKSESEQQRTECNDIIRESIREGRSEDMTGFIEALARAAEEKLTLRPPRVKKRDCHPELERIVACRKIALEQDDEEEVKRLTKLLKRRARRIRTEEQMNKFQDWEWDPVKYYKRGFVAKFTNLKDETGRLVNDRMRPDTFADYFEKIQWARSPEIDQQEHDEPVPIYDTEAEVNQDHFTREELDKAITRLNNNKTPGPNRVTSELVKLLDEEGRNKLLDLLNRCWEGEELYEEINQADLAVIYKKEPADKPENYRPIALLNIGYKLMASMIQKRLSEAMDDRIDPAQFGSRKGRSTAQPIHMYRRIQEIHEEAGLELITILLDRDKAFDKIHQGKLVNTLRRIGIPDKVVRVIEAIYRSPKFSVKEMGKRSSERRQKSGIRQACPLSPYLFVIVMTVIMKDIDNQLSHEGSLILSNEQPIGIEGHDKLLYADDTLILASSRKAAEIMFHKIQEESNMRLNHETIRGSVSCWG